MGPIEGISINWHMVTAITGILSLVIAIIGGLILAAAKSMFITTQDFKKIDNVEKNLREKAETIERNIAVKTKHIEKMVDNKLYDKSITIFMPRKECEKCRAEIKAATSTIVPREEWEKSKAYRERRMDENQRIVCGKIDKITESIIAIAKEQGDTNRLLSALQASFAAHLDKSDGRS